MSDQNKALIAPAATLSLAEAAAMTGQNYTRPLFETHRNDAESRALARKDLETRMISRTNAVHTDFSWATRTLITSLPAGDPAISMLAGRLAQDNALAPIHTLPVEMFLVVLSYIVDGSRTKYAPLSIVGAVCTSWRRIIVSSPSLWTSINLCKRVDFALALDRSCNAPINVTFNGNPCANTLPDIYAAISHHATHIASLEFRLPSYPRPNATLLENFPSSFPLLHTLIFRSYTDLKIPPGESFLLRNTSIGNSAMPVLRKLCLNRVSLPWTLPFFRGLVDLHIELDVEEPVFLNLEVFRDGLASCPQLESLLLHGVGPVPTESKSDIAAVPVPLPNLHMLDLHYCELGSATCAELVVGSIGMIPPTVDLSIGFRGLDDNFVSLQAYPGSADTSRLHFADHSGWNPRMHWLFNRFPAVREARYSISRPSLPEELDSLSAMLADPYLQQLEILTTHYVPLGVLATILKTRGTGMLKQPTLWSAATPGTETDEREDLEFLKEQVGDVYVDLFWEEI
ncbi:hypothetical protein EVG20_g2878 [Dentipellis fragilis]|uniref:F-box domain-containing protein n=1 Tax=Dentipellis fragilis TaxID=205917 RepID=A0A4Y9Z7X5_9AGAM|nr:hypothetical protein EVG20_g2878 [Dentipellis fragilis]